jgi:putative copper resistance protein D
MWLPVLLRGGELAALGARRILKWVTAELLIAVAVVLIATSLAGTVPAKHAGIEDWPYDFRLSVDATWNYVPGARLRIVASILLTGIALTLLGWKTVKARSSRTVTGAAICLVAGAGALALYNLSTAANPYTYRSTTVPFDAISIARGIALFDANCVSCHGLQGKGDGPAASRLPKRPVDFLTEPHTAQHTVGDFFFWITAGIGPSGMPAFNSTLSEDDRWDVVNFLHALARGYQSRVLGPRVVPDRPVAVLGAPDFSFETRDGVTGTLNDFRQRKAVLLVLFSWPDSQSRLAALDRDYAAVQRRGAEIIAVPFDDAAPGGDWPEKPAYPVVARGAREIAKTYTLFRRTLSAPDFSGPGTHPKHMELLVDRFGYLRARWIPQQGDPGWLDPSALMAQLDQLKREKQILPPAEDHVH